MHNLEFFYQEHVLIAVEYEPAYKLNKYERLENKKYI